MANEASTENGVTIIGGQSVDLNAHAARIGKRDKLATVILTVIVGLVLALLAAIVIYILAQGLWKVFQPGFITNPSTNKELPGIAYQLFDSFYMLVITLIISVPISLGGAIFLVEYAPDNWVTSAASTAIETHNMEQATRVSDRTAFFYMGDMVETGTTKQIFSAPKDQRLADYLSGRFG